MAKTRRVWIACDGDISKEVSVHIKKPHIDINNQWVSDGSELDVDTYSTHGIIRALFGSLPAPGECWEITDVSKP